LLANSLLRPQALARPSRSSLRCISVASAPAAPNLDGQANPSQPHISVLLNEILGFMQPVNLKVYVDCTLGAGGHAAAMAQAHPEMHTLVGIDLDPTAHQIAGQRINSMARRDLACHFVRGNYCDVEPHLKGLPCGSLHGVVDGMLMDLGVSSMQLDTAERGFSFVRDGPIDMRMDPQAALSAEEVLNTWSEARLGQIIRDYGEEKMWRAIARRIVAAREEKAITSTKQLVDIVGRTQVPSKGGRTKGKQIHPATRTFQALRIAVNDELGKLEKALPAAISALAPGGRLAVISFHSLEDRIVKHSFMRAAGRPTPDEEYMTHGDAKYTLLEELERNAVASIVTRKPVEATAEEANSNPRSRSAKLRVLQKHA